MKHKDFFGRGINVGDYIFCAVRSHDSVAGRPFVAKVAKLNAQSVTVRRSPAWAHGNDVVHIRRPERCMIITEELALQKEPWLKDVN